MKLVRKKVLGYSMIPKINEMPPKIICDTEDYFKQLENLGFTLIDMDEETPKEISKEPIKADETPIYIVSEPVNISVQGGIKIDFPEDTSVTFVEENEQTKGLETKKETEKSEIKQKSKSNKSNKNKDKKQY